MWLGVSIYTDGMVPTFKVANTREEIVKWLRDDIGYDEEIKSFGLQKDDISYEMTEVDYHIAYIVDLNAKEK